MTDTCVPVSKWARMVKDIAGNKCVICGSTKKLESHHVMPKSLHPELANDLNNGLCLCHQCHFFYHGGSYTNDKGPSYYYKNYYSRVDRERLEMVEDFKRNNIYLVYPARERIKEHIQEAAATQGISIDEWVINAIEIALRKTGE